MKLKVKTIEEENKDIFEIILNKYSKRGYSVVSSSCNCKTWKAILIKDNSKGSEK